MGKITKIITFILVGGMILYFGHHYFSVKNRVEKVWLDLGQNICLNIRGCHIVKVDANKIEFQCKTNKRFISKYNKKDFLDKGPDKLDTFNGISVYVSSDNQNMFFKKNDTIVGFKKKWDDNDSHVANFGAFNPCNIAKDSSFSSYQKIEFLK